jgi:hypothetical protein
MTETPIARSSSLLVAAAAFGMASGLTLVGLLSGSHAERETVVAESRSAPSAAARAIDADRDGVISSTEIAAASASLKVLDRDGDGLLTADELDPSRASGRSAAIDPVVAALDADRDGKLSAEEIAHTAQLRTLDRNQDGRLTADETRLSTPDERGRRVRPAGRRNATRT